MQPGSESHRPNLDEGNSREDSLHKRQKVQHYGSSKGQTRLLPSAQAQKLLDVCFPHGVELLYVNGVNLDGTFQAIAETLKHMSPQLSLPTEAELVSTYEKWQHLKSLIYGTQTVKGLQSLILDAAAILDSWSRNYSSRQLHLGIYYESSGPNVEMTFDPYLNEPSQSIVWIFLGDGEVENEAPRGYTIAGVKARPPPSSSSKATSNSRSRPAPINVQAAQQPSVDKKRKHTPASFRRESAVLFTPMSGVQGLPTAGLGRRGSAMNMDLPNDLNLPPSTPRSLIWEYMRLLSPDQQQEIIGLSRNGNADEAMRKTFGYIMHDQRLLMQENDQLRRDLEACKAYGLDLEQRFARLENELAECKVQGQELEQLLQEQDSNSSSNNHGPRRSCRICHRTNHVEDDCWQASRGGGRGRGGGSGGGNRGRGRIY